MRISAVEEHGLRCLMALANASCEDHSSTISSIAAAEGLSVQYAAKLVSILRRGKLVVSERGVKGGIRLARPPRDITLEDAVLVLEGGPGKMRSCLSGTECSRHAACGLRNVWDTITRLMFGVLSRVTLENLVRVTGKDSVAQVDVFSLFPQPFISASKEGDS